MTRDEKLTTAEVARGLGSEPEDVYGLILRGELEGRPGSDGVVRASQRAVAEYLER